MVSRLLSRWICKRFLPPFANGPQLFDFLRLLLKLILQLARVTFQIGQEERPEFVRWSIWAWIAWSPQQFPRAFTNGPLRVGPRA